MTGQRHSYQCDSVAAAYSAETIAQHYITSPHRRLSRPSSPSLLRGAPDINLVSPSSPKKKKKKPKERRRNSKTRGKGDLNCHSDESVEADETAGEICSPLVSPSTPSKKKKRPKKSRHNSQSLGVVIIPDCANEANNENEKEVHHDESARFSAVTEPTQLLDDDDFTEATKDASSKNEIVKFSKSPKTTRKKKLPKENTGTSSVEKIRTKTPDKKRTKTPDKKRTKTPDKKRTKTPTNARRSSLTKRIEKRETVDDNKNASWGTDTRGSKSFKALELLSLAADPGLQLEGLEIEVGRPPSFQKSNSFDSIRKATELGTRRGSFGSNLDSQTKLRERQLRSKQIQDATLGMKNETWGSPQTPTGIRRGSYSPELLTLYTSPYRSEKPPPQLRKNVKSFNSGESWRTDPKRDRDIPSILFISSEEPEPGFNESWDSRFQDKPSTVVRGKETIDGTTGLEQHKHKPRARSAGAVGRRRSSTRQTKEKPPQPLRKKEPPSSNVNEKWDADPRSMSNKTPLSPRLVDMLGVSPHSTKKKSSGRLKKTISVGRMKSSPSLNSLKNNFKKLRGGATKENKLKAIPML